MSDEAPIEVSMGSDGRLRIRLIEVTPCGEPSQGVVKRVAHIISMDRAGAEWLIRTVQSLLDGSQQVIHKH